MPLIFPVNDTKDFNQAIREIAVTSGSLVVTVGGKTTTVTEDNSPFDLKDQAAVHVYSPDGGTAAITYSHEAQEQTSVEQAEANAAGARKRASKRRRSSSAKSTSTPRGDTGGGDSGGFESRTVKQLRAECKKRKIDVPSKATKPQLIAALRKAA